MPKMAFLFILFFSIASLFLLAYALFSLDLIERLVENKFPIKHIAWQDFKKEISLPDSNQYLLFDTRLFAEYQTSHLRSAIQIDPEMPPQDFLKTYGDTLRDKRVVFYCSAGYRSSIFVQRVQSQAIAAGALSVRNLRGGIFRWYNENNPVVDAHGETDNIHPYDSFWRVLVRERSKAKKIQH